MLTPKDVLKLIKQGEGQVLEFKASAILGDNFELAKDMGAMANAEGGQILIGVLDDGTIEGMKAKEGHEEHIMLVSTSRCSPPLRVSFENIRIPRKGDVYVIIIQRRGIVFHGVRTEGGILAYFIRRGKIVTQLTPEEMFVEELKEKYAGVEVQYPETPISRFLMAQGRRILQKVFKRLDVRARLQGILLATGSLIGIAIFFLYFTFENGMLTFRNVTYPLWANVVIVTGIVVAVASFSMTDFVVRTTCPECHSCFSYERAKAWILEEKRKRRRLLRIYRCIVCGHTERKFEFEEIE